VGDINANARGRLGLDTPGEALGLPEHQPEAEATPGRRNGRAKATA
jgi:hypothetical protein